MKLLKIPKGTTGVPKGVCIAHQGVVNQIQQVSQHVTPPQFTRVTLFSSRFVFFFQIDFCFQLLFVENNFFCLLKCLF